MTAELHIGPAYDQIAHLYDFDMAQNMRFPDVDFYARVSASRETRARAGIRLRQRPCLA
jgi:hypothetical protein